MEQIDKRIVNTIDSSGNPIKLYLKPPDYEITRLCDIEFKKAWTFCFQEGVKTHAKLEQMFRDSGDWTDEHNRQLNELNVTIAVKTVLLEKFKKQNNQASNDLALEIMELRNKAMRLSQLKQQPYQYSCEHAAQEIRMEAYISYATVYYDDQDKRYFTNYKDFTERREEQAALDIYNVYLQIILKENTEYIQNLPENKYLMEAGVLDENMKPIRKKNVVKEKKKRTTKKTKKRVAKKG
jgi:hypothetical protein